VGELTSELVHALRNPVSTLTTSLELLVGGMADPEDVPQLHRVMRKELSRLDELLGRCRELCGLSGLTLATVELGELVRSRLAQRSTELSARRTELALQLPSHPVMIRGDASHLGGALDALASNALEAMPDGGTLSVALTHVPGSNAASVVVTDTGVGIAAVALRNVFRLFYTTKPGASGVGLTLVRQVAAAHGGTVDLASEQGRGTTVTLKIRGTLTSVPFTREALTKG
jgi:two-component system sensor histidine kinase HydH